ncbi:uncharacterized protein MYCGRDRAFT_96370 [Zymoseptoria tritici IPO323]|uniref:BTB domain-containing protein n=1 Tax=Zymoseptoria tritici (strain CBS 115943 / IPO323) TaxID=336722 RepID=F9XLW8_ZYMTI|nr:uncharacterized protein MYCGRDRAFT_96370 [Zymoseptoria tritici IPO323]EGP84017.1 hypothetical protein MYCGRDRAFT_96370 [Zymoseptoria tritici IPO323]
MDTAGATTTLFNDPTYSDCIVMPEDGGRWHCHKRILFAASKLFHDEWSASEMCEGKDEICMDSCFSMRSVEVVLRFIYGSCEADLFEEEQKPDWYIAICITAWYAELPELLEMAIRGLRQALNVEKSARTLVCRIRWMRREVPEMIALADEVESERMPWMLGDDEARAIMRGDTIRAYFDRVLIMKKEDGAVKVPLR